MNKIKIGITGQSGFIGYHLYNRIKLNEYFELINFDKSFFENESAFDTFVLSCDCIVHLAGVNRAESDELLYNKNIELSQKLIDACIRTKHFPHIMFSSSSQEKNDNAYGKAKRMCRTLFTEFAKKYKSAFTAFIIPNVFGEFCRPNYNSVVATFAHRLITNETPQIIQDMSVPFMHVASLCDIIITNIKKSFAERNACVKNIFVPEDFTLKVSSLLDLFQYFFETYFKCGIIPVLKNKNDINLFNTFRSYIPLEKYFPVLLKKHTDERGCFIETAKLGIGGQVSFSTTVPGITRGNHFHTRKIERFTVIKGKAKIELRKIGCDTVYSFLLDGDNPSYVDMPCWYTHNITNIGDEDLYTQFWINEWYNASDADTFYEKV